MRKLLAFIMFCLPLVTFGQVQNEAVVQEVLEKTRPEGRIISFDFSVTRTLSMMDQPLVSTGHAEMKYPEELVWEIKTPQPKTSVISPGKYSFSEKDFDISVSEEGKLYVLCLKPMRKSRNQMFSDILIYADKKDYRVERIVITDRNGDISDIKISSFTSRNAQ